HGNEVQRPRDATRGALPHHEGANRVRLSVGAVGRIHAAPPVERDGVGQRGRPAAAARVRVGGTRIEVSRERGHFGDQLDLGAETVDAKAEIWEIGADWKRYRFTLSQARETGIHPDRTGPSRQE